MKLQVETWDHGVRVLVKYIPKNPQLACSGLGMLLQLDWQYLEMTVLVFGTLIGPIEEALRRKFFPVLFVGKISSPASGNPRP